MMHLTEKNRTHSALTLMGIKLGLAFSAGFTGLLLARFALKMLAVSGNDLASHIFTITDIIVKPFTALIAPLTFSTGAVVEVSSLLPAVILVIITGAFLWRLYLDHSEPLHVQCVHVKPT